MPILGVYTVTEEQERLDRIARKLYGSEGGGSLEALLTANPGLSALGPFVPRGYVLTVPALPLPAANPAYQRPWE